MEEKTRKMKIKLKEPAIKLIRNFVIILIVIGIAFGIYKYEISLFTRIGYSEKSGNYILFHGLKEEILAIGENKTLDRALSSELYNEDYFNNYRDITYVDHEDLIKNINKLIKKGYNNSNISLILTHGSNSDVSEFAKRDRVRYVEEFLSYDFARLGNYDRYVKYSDETGEDDLSTVIIVNSDIDKEAYTDYRTIDKFSTDMIVNKHRKLVDGFVPDNLVNIPNGFASDSDMQGVKVAVDSFVNMANAASSEGYGLIINSAYRSYEDQEGLCDYYRRMYGDDYVTKYVAQPGFSEHQTGLGFDIGSTTVNVFANSKEYTWMLDNAYKYGFILRFPKKFVDMTEFNNEPWHYRYVGVEIATYIHEHNMSYEEYYARFLDF